MRVLVVDDHPAMRAGVALILELDLGATEVVEAPDVATALEVVARDGFDLVVVDLLLPGRDGVSLIAELTRERPALPIIALSSSDDPADRQRALAAGALGFVTKSADRDRFAAAVRVHVTALLQVLGVDNRTRTLVQARARGFFQCSGARDVVATARRPEPRRSRPSSTRDATAGRRRGVSGDEGTFAIRSPRPLFPYFSEIVADPVIDFDQPIPPPHASRADRGRAALREPLTSRRRTGGALAGPA